MNKLKIYLICVAITGLVFGLGIIGMWGLWDIVAYLVGAWISWSLVLYVIVLSLRGLVNFILSKDPIIRNYNEIINKK